MLSARELIVVLLLFGFSAPEDETDAVPGASHPTTKSSQTDPDLIINTIKDEDADVNGFDPDPDVELDLDGSLGLGEPALLPDFVDQSDLICRVCNCTVDWVDCHNRDLRSPFEIEHWNGLKALGIQDISNVDLSGNYFVSVTQFPALPISRLNLSNCEIKILEDAAFSNLKYLTILDLSKNKMSLINGKGAFMGILEEGMRPMPFMYLQYLSLAYNDIHSLSQDLFMFMPNLMVLDLSGNPLISIDQVTMGALADLMRLKELRISECELETLPTGIFRRLRKLQRLDLSGNKFSVVPKPISEAVNLHFLNFNRNHIQAISEKTAISNLTKLEELHFSRHSKLRSISEGALGGLESLVKLHISYNPRLSVLDPKFLEWEDDFGVERRPLLEELYLNNNNISEIDSRILERWNHLTRVDFTANPYFCDCNNQWMVDVLVPLIMGMTTTNTSTAKMICRKPYDYRGLTFAQLYESGAKLPCALGESVSDGSGMETAVLYGVLVGILIAFPLVMVVVILWKKGYFAKCRKKMTASKDYYDDEETDAF